MESALPAWTSTPQAAGQLSMFLDYISKGTGAWEKVLEKIQLGTRDTIRHMQLCTSRISLTRLRFEWQAFCTLAVK